MKKYAIYVIIICLITAIAFHTYSIQATDLSNEKSIITDMNQLNAFKSIIDDYFNAYYLAVKSGTTDALAQLITDAEFKEYAQLSAFSKYSYFSKLNDRLHSYQFTSNIKHAKAKGNKCIVNVNLDSQQAYESAPNSIGYSKGDNYVFVLEQVGDKWLIVRVIHDMDESADEGKAADSNYIKNKIKLIKEAIKDEDERIHEIKKMENRAKEANMTKMNTIISNSIIATGSGGTSRYNSSAAIYYAHKWCYSFNPSYPTFSNDCTNFTSQAVYAGYSSFGNGWYCYDYGVRHIPSRWDFSYSWIRVVDFHNWIINNTGLGPHGYTTAQAQLGDIIQFFKISANTYTHGAIVTKIDSNGIVRYTGHSTARYDYSVREVLGNYEVYSKVRYIHIN